MKKLTRNQAKEIRALKRMKDDEIDFTDIPLTRDWSDAIVGKFYQPAGLPASGKIARPTKQVTRHP